MILERFPIVSNSTRSERSGCLGTSRLDRDDLLNLSWVVSKGNKYFWICEDKSCSKLWNASSEANF
jgi:hypothetical protein